jgi:hypothetical protein
MFVDAVEEFRVLSQAQESSKETYEEAQGIARSFLRRNAMLEVNVSDSVRRSVLANIEAKRVSADLFDDAYDQIYGLMERDSFLRFLRSNIYKTFIAEQHVITTSNRTY